TRGDVLDPSDEELAGRIGQRAELHDERALRRKRRFRRCDGGLPGAPVFHARLDTALSSEKSVKTPVNLAPVAYSSPERTTHGILVRPRGVALKSRPTSSRRPPSPSRRSSSICVPESCGAMAR